MLDFYVPAGITDGLQAKFLKIICINDFKKIIITIRTQTEAFQSS